MPKGRGRWVFVFFVIALVLTFFAGSFVQRHFSPPSYEQLPQQFLSLLERSSTQEALTFQFDGRREIPWGPGLEEWLEGFPEAARIRRLVATYTVQYSVDGGGDWELRRDPTANLWVIFSPRPEFDLLQFQSQDIQIEADPSFSPEELQLAREFVTEKLRITLTQEEDLRREDRWNEVRERIIAFVRTSLTPNLDEDQRVEVVYSNDPLDRLEDL